MLRPTRTTPQLTQAAWLAILIAVLSAACASPVRRPLVVPAAIPQAEPTQAPRTAPPGRPLIGVAFGGGSARGLAHVGVIRWLEEHRVPIDLTAGTSMGGLIGGSYASGMDADELGRMVAAIDWDRMFGSSSFAFKNIRRKADARAYPSRLEFGLKGGIVPPTSLDTGQHVEFLLGQIAAPYYDLRHFDDLPTPFRAVAVDLISATEIVLDRGSLAQAMRATMSLPLIFPPVELDGRVLVDGGVMNNVPADVAKAMGADRVIAINVGDLTDREAISYSLLGLSGATLDAVMRASTKRSIAAADVVVNVPLSSFGSLDWRRSEDLIAEGYKAAEAIRDELLPFAVSADEYDSWSRNRQSRRRRTLPVPAFVTVDGFGVDDARRLNAILPRHVGVPLVIEEIERDLEVLTGLDRYETITWRLVTNQDGDSGLLVQGRAKPYAPPFMMLGMNLENTTSNDFRITLTARYLAYGALTSGSELRIDGTLGSNPAAGIELYEPIWSTPLFIAPYAGVSTSTFNAIVDDAVFARYESTFWRAGANLGVNLGTQSDLRVGAYIGHIDAEVAVGDPGLPALSGGEKAAEAIWRLNTQDSTVIPSKGTLGTVRLFHVLDYPDVRFGDESILFRSVTQFSGRANRFWSFGERNRIFLLGEFGTSFEGTPLPPDKFSIGTPMRLGSHRPGELLGNHYYVGTGGYFRQLGRLPDFIGGPVFAGTWLENGDAFDEWSDATWRTNAGFGVVFDTLIGPALVAGSAGFDGRWRTYIGIGRIFR